MGVLYQDNAFPGRDGGLPYRKQGLCGTFSKAVPFPIYNRSKGTSQGSKSRVGGDSQETRPLNGPGPSISECFLDPAATDASGADTNTLCLAVNQCPDILKVWTKCSFADTVGMADLVANRLCLSTH